MSGHIFEDALHVFSAELSNDPEKLKWIVDGNYGNMESVLASALNARNQYEGHKGDSGARDALVSFSEKIHHYGGIMDVLVSHHPEYAALAWGAMKFLLVGVVNHRKIITRLSEGLTQIADILPRAELFSRLYPVPHMRKIVVAIYSHILKFLIRALRWYQESKFMHVVHSITRPTELRYDDILLTISTLSRDMSDAAMASSQAEQRDMHTEIQRQIKGQEVLQSIAEHHKTMLQEVMTTVKSGRVEQQDMLAGIQQLIHGQEHLMSTLLQVIAVKATENVIHESANIRLRQKPSEVQLAQFLQHLCVPQLPEPIEAYQTSFSWARKRLTRPSMRGPPFWLTDKIQKWNSTSSSSLVIVNGTWKMRFHLQGFCADSVSILRESKIPVLWALKTANPGDSSAGGVSSIDLIKYLVSQAVKINESIHMDASLTPRLQSLSYARSEDEWINILASVLQGIPYLYVILDIEVLSQSTSGPSHSFWPAAFLRIFSELSNRGFGAVIKVALVCYGSPLVRGLLDKNIEDSVVTVGRARQSQNTRTRLPCRKKGNSGSESSDRLDFT